MYTVKCFLITKNKQKKSIVISQVDCSTQKRKYLLGEGLESTELEQRERS